MTTFLGEEVMLNGGPLHGKLVKIPRPCAKLLRVPVDPALLTAPHMVMPGSLASMFIRQAIPEHYRYERMPIDYATSKGTLRVWVYDYAPEAG